MTGDDIITVYNDEIIALSETTRAPKKLEKPDAAARAVSPICGSTVEVELALDGERITDIGYSVDACALTRAVMAIVRNAAPGAARAEIMAAAGAFRAMLEEGGPPPGGAFSALSLLAPVRDYPARHNAVMLPLEAVGRALAGS